MIRSKVSAIGIAVVAAAAVALMASSVAAQPSDDGAGGDGGLAHTSVFAPTSEPAKVIVVLQGDSIASAQRRAERIGAPFDRAAAQRAAAALQLQVEPALAARGATVLARTTSVLNSLTVSAPTSALATLRATPGVASIHLVRTYQRDNQTSDTYTGTPTVWGRATTPNADTTGDGMVIGIIDDGIDYLHADFGGSGNPADYSSNDPTTIEASSFPTTKVVGGYDFAGDQYDANADAIACDELLPGDVTSVPCDDPDPLACGEHGTHVAGTAAGQGVLDNGSTFTGPYGPTTFTGRTFAIGPGSAPEAKIRMYKVFGCGGSVGDDVLLAAIDQAATDGVDVLNLSLGSSFGTRDDPLALALDGATESGVMVVASAGNSGPGAYILGGPGSADTALSVAAADVSSATFPSVHVQVGASGSFDALNSNRYTFSGPITGTVVDVGLGCSDGDYATAAGKIVVAHRGTCDRVDRAIKGDAAGALAVILVNYEDEYPPMEGAIPGVSIPFIGATLAQGEELSNGASLTISDGGPIANPDYAGYAPFTSNGPRIDNVAKPDITAPGVDLVSALVGSGTGAVALSGTSMASPHTAGIAALVRQTHPTWSPAEVKGALMATADPTRVAAVDIVRGGPGMVDAPDAADTVATITTMDGTNSLSFGFRELSGSYQSTKQLRFRNDSGSAITYDLSSAFDHQGTSATITYSANPLTVPANSTATLSVTLNLPDPQYLPDATDSNSGTLATLNGLVAATPRGAATGVHTLHVPLLLVAKGLSDVRVAGATTTPSRVEAFSAFVPTELQVVNSGPHAGTYDIYQWAIADEQGDVSDAVVPDLLSVGVAKVTDADGTQVKFAINSAAGLSSYSTARYEILIDADFDYEVDYALVVIDSGWLDNGPLDGTLAAVLLQPSGRYWALVTAGTVTAPANGSIVEAGVLSSYLPASFLFAVASSSWFSYESDDTGVGFFVKASPGVGPATSGSLAARGAADVATSYNRTASINQGALGWMVVSFDDAAGSAQADTIPILVDAPAPRP